MQVPGSWHHLVLTLAVVGGVSGSASAQTPAGTGSVVPTAQPGDPGKPGTGDPAYQSALHNAIPLTPAMIEDLRRRYDAVEASKATNSPNNLMASPQTRSINISLGPGGATPIIQTVPGYPTALAFLDATGQPWPIAWDTNGIPDRSGNGGSRGPTVGAPAVDAVGFDALVPAKGSNVLQLQPRNPDLRGGILVNLQGAPKPIAFMVVSGRSQYDADVSIRVADRGPNAKVAIITRPDTPETGAPYLTAMLDGVPPSSAVPLSVEGVSPDDVRAWQIGDRDYIRTRYTLLSPEWVASEDGEDGTTIYAVPTTPVVLLSADGRTVAARLGGSGN